MSTRVRLAIAGLSVLGLVAGVVGFALRRRSSDEQPAAFRVASAGPAAAPFAGFGEGRLAVGKRCLRVLVASDAAQRSQGLRAVRDFGAYDGMVFVFPGDTVARFTMADTLIPLDIGWFGPDGAPVDRARMVPCPEGDDATCPSYRSRGRYRYALETAAGQLGGGSLGGC